MSVNAADNVSAKKLSLFANSNSISDGQELGRWWAKSAKKYNPLPNNPLLYHFEGNYSYSESSGNVEAEAHRAGIELTLRKYLVTSITDYAINNRETMMQLTGMGMVMKDENFRQAFRLAITNKLDAVVGRFWKRSSTKYLQDRFIYYGGVRFMMFDTPNLDLMLGGFYAETETSFMNSKFQNIRKYNNFPDVDDYDSNAIRLSEMLHWKITPTISLDQTLDYMMLLENTDYYLWTARAALNFKLSKNFSFVTSYMINYDYNPFIEAIQSYLDNRRVEQDATTGNIHRRDTKLSFGVKFTF